MKYKRMTAVLLAFCCLTACKNTKIDDEVYNYSESVIRAVDAYLDNQISYDEAKNKVSGMLDQFDIWRDQHPDNDNSATNTLLRAYISSIDYDLYREHSGIGTYADLLDERNKLAEEIGY